jgi:hypothetical protein
MGFFLRRIAALDLVWPMLAAMRETMRSMN